MSNIVRINGVDVDVTTIMDKSATYTPNPEKVEKVKTEIVDLLNEYEYEVSIQSKGINDMFKADGIHYKNKAWLYALFSKHPQYDGEGRIVIPNSTMIRTIDLDAVTMFFRWVEKEIEKIAKDNRIDKVHPISEIKNTILRLTAIKSAMLDFRSSKIKSRYMGMDIHEVDRELTQWIRVKDSLITNYTEFSPRDYVENVMLDNDFAKELKNAKDAFYYIKQYVCNKENDNVQLCGKVLADKLNSLYPEKRVATDTMRISKVVSRIAKKIGLDKIVNIITDFHGRPKDYGYNLQFALFADAINPIITEKTFVISINPLDFYTMSFGNSWTSCHTIDKLNRRRSDYNGEYSAGVESYLLDNSSFITYYREDNLTEDNKYEKLKRCVFYLGEDKLIQSRVYPDGRDGGDAGLPKTIRELVQHTISELYGVPNFWNNLKGTDNCSSMIYSKGKHYRDYIYYSDCNVSFLKRIDGYINENQITVGHDTICPHCGNTHGDSSCISCCVNPTEDDDDYRYCERCDTRFYYEDGVYDENTGNWYCCADCAESRGVYFCDNDGCYHSEHVYFDNYTNDYFYSRYDEYYETEDGDYVYQDLYNARGDGFELDDNTGYLYPEEDFEKDAYDGTVFRPDAEAVHINEKWYINADNAERDGWTYNEEINEWTEVA